MQWMDLEVTDDFEIELPQTTLDNITIESPKNIKSIYQTSLAIRFQHLIEPFQKGFE